MTEPTDRQLTITEAQFEIWMNHPVTKTYLSTLDQYCENRERDAGQGRLLNSSSADMTHALLHRNIGQQDSLLEAQNPEALMSKFERIIYPPDPEDENPDA